MWVAVHIYGIGRMVYELVDGVCTHFIASKHFDRRVHGCLNDILMDGDLSGKRTLLYHVWRREGCVRN